MKFHSFNFWLVALQPDHCSSSHCRDTCVKKKTTHLPTTQNVEKWVLEFKKKIICLYCHHHDQKCLFQSNHRHSQYTPAFAIHTSIPSVHFAVIVLWNSSGGRPWKKKFTAVTNSTTDWKCLLCNSCFRAPKTQKLYGARWGLYTGCARISIFSFLWRWKWCAAQFV